MYIIVKKEFVPPINGQVEEKEIDVELFTWEKLDYVDPVKKAFGLK